LVHYPWFQKHLQFCQNTTLKQTIKIKTLKRKLINQYLKKIMIHVNSRCGTESTTSCSLGITGDMIFLYFLTFLEICVGSGLENCIRYK
jgi:hypothetical protein